MLNSIEKINKMKQTIIILIGLIIGTVSFGQNAKNDTEGLVILQGENEIKFDEASELNVARYGFGYTNDDNFIYVANGGSVVFPFQNSIERYDQSTKSWKLLDANLIQKRYGSMELIDGKLYVFNGITNGKTGVMANNSMEVYDLKEDKIEVKKKRPDPVSYAGSATWNGKIYTFGGRIGKFYSNRLYTYDPKSDSWTKLAKMKEKKQTQGEIINGKLYTIGGFNGEISNKIHEYNIETNTWKHFADLPVSISAHSTTVFDDKIWIVGDYEKLNFLATFDPKTKEFKTFKSDMEGRRHSGCAILNNKLMIFGGNNASERNSTLKSVQMSEL
jgi:N-acetylneuraminic acid mutarotase